ncbi:hypothetical protein [Nonomuraea sp. B19D2]|uniref:hypothetical protein n=1 Tax=Nonomuraea sp. B19D2 TaxID=3159561 RepID=UPI0032DB362C
MPIIDTWARHPTQRFRQHDSRWSGTSIPAEQPPVSATLAAMDKASADLRKPMAAIRELRRAVTELGFKALRIVPWLWELPPDDRRYHPCTPIASNSASLLHQVGHTGPLRPSEPPR